MTKIQERGRELNARIAREIMGLEIRWRWVPFSEYPICDVLKTYPEGHENAGKQAWRPCPSYSQEITTAWLVWDRLPESVRGLPAQWAIHRTGPGQGSLVCTLDDCAIEWFRGPVPEVICLAALHAKQVEEEASQ